MQAMRAASLVRAGSAARSVVAASAPVSSPPVAAAAAAAASDVGLAAVRGLQPESVFKYFAQLAQIPRPSRKEG
ncbi:hypothetical protein MNEG_12558, partial [Monoraphidium neglectum]